MHDRSGSAEEYRQLFAASPYALLVCDRETGAIREANEAALSLFSATRDDLIGMPARDLVIAEQRDSFSSVCVNATERSAPSGPWRFGPEREGFDGAVVSRLIGIAGSRLLVMGIEDITERLERDAQLAASEERYRTAIEGAKDGIWDWDLTDDAVFFSARWKRILGYEDDEIGTSPDEWLGRVHPEDIEGLRFEIDLHLQGVTPHLEHEYRLQHKDGSWRWVLTRGVAVRADGVAVRIAGSQTDITERKQAEDRLVHDALYDHLTTLANRSLFLDRVGFLSARARRSPAYTFAVLVIDVDRFKLINETRGQSVGDEVLVETARRLAQAARGSDTVARLGADEFGVLMDGLDDFTEASHAAEEILEALRDPIETADGEPLAVTGSVGIAVSTGESCVGDEILRNADIAMHRAKAAGGNRYEVFDAWMHQEAITHARTERELRRAIDSGQLELHYQPIVSMDDGVIRGAEALVRWRHPEQGLLFPGAFIPVAEESGLIAPLGEWVMREACRQNATWRAEGLPAISISVNLSAHQFRSATLKPLVRSALEDVALPGDALTVELTESVVMSDPEEAMAVIADLEELGVSLAMDDFGTGYSSLGYLKRFRFGSLKIDRSFIQDVDEDAQSASLVAAVIGLSHSFRARAVGEGVETVDQLSYLRLLRCDMAQGYLFSRPVPAADFAQLLARPPDWTPLLR